MLLDHLGIHRAGAISPGVADADPMQLARGVLNVALARAGRALSKVRRLHSIRAIATAPRPQNIWKDGALIWKDANNYLYARTTRTGRIIVGGEDSEKIVEPDARDRLIPEKSRVLAQRLSALWPRANTDIALGWSGTFDTASDGLPLIGPVPGAEGVYAA
jgi:glycine/D-amino acid oxidase-like deaminating enzyme